MTNEQEQINEIFEDESKFIGEFRCDDYKVMRGYIGGLGEELRLYYTKFEPTIKKASICIVHGFGEHQGRFLHLADFFAKNQFIVHLIDMRGFGYSGGSRGAQTIPQLHMDLEVLLRQVSRDLPLFLYGHAMGGLLIITLIMRNPSLNISGVITTSPMLGLPLDRKLKGFKYLLVKFVGQYLEDLVINTKLNPTALTKNNYNIQRCFSDRLMIPFLGIGMARSIMDTVNLLARKRQHFKESILIFHGKENTFADYKDSVNFYDKCGSTDKTLKLFENGYHELQHDEEYEEMKSIMSSWLQARIPKAKPFGIIGKVNYGLSQKKKKIYRRVVLAGLFLIYLYFCLKYWRLYKTKMGLHKLPILPVILCIRFVKQKFNIN